MDEPKIVGSAVNARTSFLSDLIKGSDFRIAADEFFGEHCEVMAIDKAAQCFANASDPRYESLISQIAAASHIDLEGGSDNEDCLTLNALHYCAVYYENIGVPEQTMAIAQRCLDHSIRMGNDNLIRRAHSLLGFAYMRVCEFDNALKHMHRSFLLATKNEEPTELYITLANTVTVLEQMGLLREAQKLSLKIALEKPFGSEKLDCVHFVNATNGIRISHFLGDAFNSDKFYNIAFRAAKTKSSFVTQLNRANFELARISNLILQGNLESATKIVRGALRKVGTNNNIKIKALMLCAKAECSIASGVIGSVIESKHELESFAERVIGPADTQEEVLQYLVRIYEFLGIKIEVDSNNRSEEFRRRLKIHSLGVKHKSFFSRCAPKDDDEKDKKLVLENPWYDLPDWVTIAGKIAQVKRVASEKKQKCIREKRVPYSFLGTETIDEKSRVFQIAENWAIAVEYALGGDGHTCSRVSLVVAEMAREVGMAPDITRQLELACRLHDVGRVVVAFAPPNQCEAKAFGRFSLLSGHPRVGAELLSQFEDRVLQLAAKISLTHHECWNGCGYPTGLRGLEIPIEARMCAVADFFVSLVYPSSHHEIPWPPSLAIRQIQTMSGVQFDPAVCDVLARVSEGQSNIWLQEGIKSSVAYIFEPFAIAANQDRCLSLL